MSDPSSESDTSAAVVGRDDKLGALEADREKLDLSFDSTNPSTKPSLRKPKLTEAELSAAVKLGFSEKYLPSSVTGGEGISGPQQSINLSDRSNYKSVPTASMINNNHGNSNNSQVSGSQNNYPFFVDNYSFGLTREQQEGLLDPLRRPTINQIPPDVLAVLLKSPRFEEILIPTQRRLATEISSNPSAAAQSQLVLPEPSQSRASTSTVDQSTASGGSSSTASSNNTISSSSNSTKQQSSSKLSPFAKEFVPSANPPQAATMTSSQDTCDLAYAMAQVEVQDQHDSFQSLAEELDGSDCILSTVTDMISQVSQDPASLNRCTKMTVDVLKKHLMDECTLGIVVTLMFEQMISNPNFCYSGAKILESINENGIGVGGKKDMFKHLVLTRIQEEFTNCISNLDDPEIRVRTLGVLRLLSEAYMNFGILQNNSKLDILALAVLELMQELIKKDKSPDAIKCVCQLLKLIGWEVDNSKSPKVKEYFEGVLKELSYARMCEGNHPTCEALIDMIFKLRSNNWNRGQEDTSCSTAAPAPAGTQKQPVYYELPDSDDDSFGDEGGIMLDDEPDEVQAAYEEFLKMSSKSK